MSDSIASRAGLHCLRCGRREPAGADWDRIEHPPLGSLTQCPECGSTNIEQIVE